MSIALFFGIVLRVLVCMICLSSLAILAVRFKKNSQRWNVKTRDYWYSFLMWSLAGFVLSVQGLIEGRLITPAIVFATAASITTLKGLRRKGAWGSDR